MRHLDDLEEYKSYAVQELSTFRAWCKKWTNDCIVLLVYFSLEVLAPARLLSKSFQDEIWTLLRQNHQFIRLNCA